eukprot:574181-Alexandrium_andersonii.AAC.1
MRPRLGPWPAARARSPEGRLRAARLGDACPVRMAHPFARRLSLATLFLFSAVFLNNRNGGAVWCKADSLLERCTVSPSLLRVSTRAVRSAAKGPLPSPARVATRGSFVG